MKNVVHIGPLASLGGMSSVIRILAENPPEGWSSDIVDTFSNSGIRAKVVAWRDARRRIKSLAEKKRIDLAHIHVTHSFSWWRKRDIMNLCDKLGIRIVVHIHSGKFDTFCRGISGLFVRKEFQKNNRKVVVLEKRWLKSLESWIPEDSVVVPNSVDLRRCIFEKKTPSFPLTILMLSRGAKMKGHGFALEVHKLLNTRKIRSKLIIAGVERGRFIEEGHSGVDVIGWISEEEKRGLLNEADFVLSPSEYEGSSMTVIESIANGIPCICSPASAETIGIGSLVINLDNPEKWADKIEELSNPESYMEIVESLRVQRRRFDVIELKSDWVEIYNNASGK